MDKDDLSEGTTMNIDRDAKEMLKPYEYSKSDTYSDIVRGLASVCKSLPDSSYLYKWLVKNYEQVGFSQLISNDKNKYPRLLMKYRDKIVRVDVEVFSRQFLLRRIPSDTVDIIVCLSADQQLEGVKTIEVPLTDLLEKT